MCETNEFVPIGETILEASHGDGSWDDFLSFCFEADLEAFSLSSVTSWITSLTAMGSAVCWIAYSPFAITDSFKTMTGSVFYSLSSPEDLESDWLLKLSSSSFSTVSRVSFCLSTWFFSTYSFFNEAPIGMISNGENLLGLYSIEFLPDSFLCLLMIVDARLNLNNERGDLRPIRSCDMVFLSFFRMRFCILWPRQAIISSYTNFWMRGSWSSTKRPTSFQPSGPSVSAMRHSCSKISRLQSLRT